MVFSILICTYNGAERLPATLTHLASLHIPEKSSVELWVINNACTDETDNVVQEIWKKQGSPFRLHLLHMPLEGKGHALALGIAKSKGDYVVICDDDNWLQPDYLQVAYQYISQYPKAAIMAGQAEAVADVPLPDWFAEKQWVYACGTQQVGAGNTTGKKLLWSAGMVLQHSLANVIFNGPVPMLLLGRTGTQLVSGEDDEICLRAWLLGAQTHYVPGLIFRHYMAAHRLSLKYRDALIAGFSYQSNAIGSYWRLYNLIECNQKYLLLGVRKGFAWFTYKVTRNKQQERHAADFLYYITGWNFFKTPENESVRNFYVAQKRKAFIT